MANAAHNARPRRESLRKRLGKMIARIEARDGGRCVYCGRTAIETGHAMQFDHLVPRSEGGLDVAENLVCACINCNSSRQNLGLAAWCRKASELLGRTITWQAVRAQARRALPAL